MTDFGGGRRLKVGARQAEASAKSLEAAAQQKEAEATSRDAEARKKSPRGPRKLVNCDVAAQLQNTILCSSHAHCELRRKKGMKLETPAPTHVPKSQHQFNAHVCASPGISSHYALSNVFLFLENILFGCCLTPLGFNLEVQRFVPRILLYLSFPSPSVWVVLQWCTVQKVTF